MRPLAALALLASLGCSSGPTHHFRMINARRSPRAEPCREPTVYTDRGPDRPREALAVLTAECDSDHPEQCRTAMQAAACEVNADAVERAEAHPILGSRNRVRMVGTAIEWQPEGAPR